jgi:hypothetical protein
MGDHSVACAARKPGCNGVQLDVRCAACGTNFEGPPANSRGIIPQPEGVNKSSGRGRAPKKNPHPDADNFPASSRPDSRLWDELQTVPPGVPLWRREKRKIGGHRYWVFSVSLNLEPPSASFFAPGSGRPFLELCGRNGGYRFTIRESRGALRKARACTKRRGFFCLGAVIRKHEKPGGPRFCGLSAAVVAGRGGRVRVPCEFLDRGQVRAGVE